MDQKQKMLGIKIGAGVVVLLLVLWQAVSMFSASDEDANKPLPNPEIPKAAELVPKEPVKKEEPVPLAAKEQDLTNLQQDVQAKYVAALNELQMLKINKDIAVVNKDILKAKEDAVTSLTKMNDMLESAKKNRSGGSANRYSSAQPETGTVAAPTTAPVATTVATTTPVKTVEAAPPPPPPTPPADYYMVVSISNIHGHWLAVVNGDKTLYKVSVGDVLMDDDSKVIAIDRSGVTLEKNGIKKKVYMSTII